MSVIGVVVCGIAVGFFKYAAFGVDPYQSLMAGLDALIPFDFGAVYAVMTALCLAFALIFDRHYIGLATFINLFFLGYIAQYTQTAITVLFPSMGIAGRILCLIIGILMLCVSSAFYMTSDLGVSSYDAISLIISKTWHKGQFKFVRIISDLICVVLGAVAYYIATGSFSGVFSIIGVGTILTAFFMGPLVDYFNRTLAEPFLNRN